MTTPAAVIPKDLINELKRLAIAANGDENSFSKAQDQFISAGERLSSSAAAFATNLYKFAQRYASQEKLIDDQLADLKISYESPSVYKRIVRMAFADVRTNDNDAIKMQISRYGRLIERAHAKNIPIEEFEKGVTKSITAMLKSLGAVRPTRQSVTDLGRAHASKLLADQTYVVKGFAPSQQINDGDEIQLVGRYDNGELVIFGMLPPDVAAVEPSYAKLGKSLLATGAKPLALLPDMVRALKLVTDSKDQKALATYQLTKSGVQFTVVGKNATAVLTAPVVMDFLSGRTITLAAQEWARLCSTLSPLIKKVDQISFDGTVFVASVDDAFIPDLGQWMEQSGAVISISTARAVDNTLEVTLTGESASTIAISNAGWQGNFAYTKDEMKPLLSFKPSETYTAFKLGPNDLAVQSSKTRVVGHINFKRSQLSLFKSAANKLFRLAIGPMQQIFVDQTDGYIRVGITAENGKAYAVTMEAG